MKNGDFIRSLDDDRLARMLFTWSINSATSFLQSGGLRLMDAKQIREWLEQLDFICEETRVPKEMIFGQDFFLKEGYNDEEQ